jgi:hypothetical protein
MELKSDFWNEFGGNVLVDNQGRVSFTPEGRLNYAPRFQRFGYVLANLRTVTDFVALLRKVQRQELEETNRQLLASLNDPDISESQKAFIRNLLGMTEAVRQSPAIADNTTSTATSAGTGANVVHVNFRAKQGPTVTSPRD